MDKLNELTQEINVLDTSLKETIMIAINEDFKNYLIPLLPDEFSQLENNILQDGCRDPIVVWDSTGFIVDGHNRYAICTKHKLPFNTFEKSFESEEEVISWIEDNQLGRRNLTPDQFRFYLGRKYNRLKSTQGGDRKSNPQNEYLKTSMKLAEQHGVSRATVERAGAMVETITEQAIPEIVEKVEQGEISVRVAATLAEVPKQEQQEIIAKGDKEILAAAKAIKAKKTKQSRAKRIDNIIEIAKGNAPLEGIPKCAVIYCDPPWQYDYAETESRAIENHYPTMTLDEIKALPINDIALEHCALYMWTTSPKLEQAFDVLKAWGFNYKTCAVWDKQVIGMGYYFRQQHEILLIATKGSLPVPLPENRPSSVYSEKREQHSSKPSYYYEILEAMYGELPKVELFCRTPKDGWYVWGNQSDKSVSAISDSSGQPSQIICHTPT